MQKKKFQLKAFGLNDHQNSIEVGGSVCLTKTIDSCDKTLLKYVLLLFFLLAVSSEKAKQMCEGEPVSVLDNHVMPMKEFVEALAGKTVLALGERHGVDGHPKAAACLLRQLSGGQDSAPVLAVEHISSADQGKIDAFRKEHHETVQGLAKVLRWWETGWPAWKAYEPLFQTAWSVRAPLYGADSRKPVTISPNELVEKFGMEKAASIRREWTAVMRDAHCNMLDPERASGLGDLQIARDAAMAFVVERASRTGAPVMFYAGRSHIRKDLAVPLHLAKGPNSRILSITLQETHIAGKPVDRSKILEEARGRYDYIWFVGEAKNDTVCEKLK